jgi:hypothetical protein
MALDFNDEEEPKITLAICVHHNLKYDPEVTWGCVLCRSTHKKRKSGYWVVGAVFVLAAAVYLLLPVIRPGGEPELSSMVAVGDRSTESGSAQTDTGGQCLRELSNSIESCIANIDSASPNARIDREFCMEELRPDSNQCTGEEMQQDYLSAPLYEISAIPQWQAVRSTIETTQGEIEKCVGSSDYDFSVRMKINRVTGVPMDVTLSLFGLDTSQRFCLYEYFDSLHFPAPAARDYVFLTNINSRMLALNRPSSTDTRKEEFKKFVEQQRNAKLYQEQHEETLRRRAEFDRKFKSGMNRR